jgi:predicted CoA-binding protein
MVSSAKILAKMNARFQSLVDRFLDHDHIAIVGYSSKKDQPANAVFDRFRDNNYEVYAINPHPEKFEHQKVYKSLSQLPELPGGVVVFTPPEETVKVLEECVSLGIVNVWIHHSIDQGSWSPEAEQFAREHDINLISSGCPLMFLSPDFPHRCLKWFLGWKGLFKVEEKAEGVAVIS